MIYNSLYFKKHESINYFYDRDTGLKAIIALHNTDLGPAIGGCRFIHYNTEEEALNDVLRLSQSMTLKAAAANLPYGGGKMVVIKNKAITNVPRSIIFKKIAEFIESMNGKYITGIDCGTSINDLNIISKYTTHVIGYKNRSITTSCYTAYSVLNSIKTAVKFLYNTTELRDLTVGIQGLGKTGYHLCKYLNEQGVKLYVSDIDVSKVDRAVKEFNAIPVDPDIIHQSEVDIFAPCAFGGIINHDTIDQFKCKIICGSANDQLITPNINAKLVSRDILYIPDYIANAGGLVSLYQDTIQNSDSSDIFQHLDKLNLNLQDILAKSKETNTSPDSISFDSIQTKFNNKYW